MKLRQRKASAEQLPIAPVPVATSKWRNWWIRSVWTFVMIAGFVGVISMGHLWMIVLVVLVQCQIYREVINIASSPSQNPSQYHKSLSLYFLASTNYFLYGESCIWYFKQRILSGTATRLSLTADAFLMPLAKHHRIISFSLYCAGFVFFVLNLKKGQYRFQFSQFGWTHMTLLFVVCQSHFIINNILEGLFWFILPVSLVICNDIMAYVCGTSALHLVTAGFFFGRTPLISISPKKTWEGFLGAFIATVVFSFFFSGLLARVEYLICPAKHLTFSVVEAFAACKPNPVFIFDKYALSPAMEALVRLVFRVNLPFVLIAPVQLHALALASFSSLIAPFGGFFASGLKRAFQIKDFGDSIPGHGGLTDRMDCQFIMGLFSFIYFQSFVGHGSMLQVGGILQSVVMRLDGKAQVELYEALGEYLVGQRLIEAVVREAGGV